MPPSLKRWSENFFCFLGLGLSLHLALLKFYVLPCIGSGGCDSIIFSGYGTVFGLPVGMYGALLWAGAILVREPTKRAALLLLLSLGSLAYMAIQFFVLRGFCPYCTAHAITAWIAFALHRETPSLWTVPLAVVLAFGGIAIARNHISRHVVFPAPPTISRGPLATAASGVAWLAPLTPRSPALVISLNCAACLDLLEELSRQSYKDVHSGPAIFFKVTDENRELTTLFVASVLAQSGSKRESFLGMTGLLLSMKDQAMSAPSVAAKQLAALVPAAASKSQAATELLQAQTATLARANVSDTTPLLVPIAAKPRPFFKTDELFGK